MPNPKLKKKRRPLYWFKYLLYPDANKRFTLEQAKKLASDPYERNMLIGDLSTRSISYKKKVIAQLERYPTVLHYEIGRISRLQIKEGKTKGVKFRASKGGVTAPWATPVFYKGGAPGLGKKR